MFQLKMYMAVSGRAPERGLQAHRRQLPTPISAPACPGSRCCLGFTSCLNERMAPRAAILWHL